MKGDLILLNAEVSYKNKIHASICLLCRVIQINMNKLEKAVGQITMRKMHRVSELQFTCLIKKSGTSLEAKYEFSLIT